MTRPPPYRTALISGVATALHYAMPDLIASRTARGWAKGGLIAVALAASVADVRTAWGAAREAVAPDGEALPSTSFGSLSTGSKAVVLGSATAVLAGAVGGVVTAERWIFRRGEARAASGRRLPHTGPALVYGALAAGLWLLPEPASTP